MKVSKLFLPLLKENPTEASIISHKLMLRGGMIRQVAAGLYNWLPIGLKVLKNIEDIVRQEMNKAGSMEILMPCIQPTELWNKSGRFGSGDDLSSEMLQMRDRHDNQLIFAPTSEEVVSQLFSENVQSYKSLPMNLYQIHWKFRDEIRPRFGLMRGREFLMKDAYSFDLDKTTALETYRAMMQAYLGIFKRLGLKAIPVAASSGSIGGDYSHEFHILANTGESLIYYEQGLESFLEAEDFNLDGFQKFYASEEEKHDATQCKVPEDKLMVKRGIEIGHVFYLGQKYSKVLEVKLQDQEGKLFYPHMGCYGIGISRLVAAIIEASHDENGMIWPLSVAPYKLAIINLAANNQECIQAAEQLIEKLSSLTLDILYEDTKDSVGAKLSKMDLIGIPYQIILGTKSLEKGVVEFKERRTSTKIEIALSDIYQYVSDLLR